MRSKKLKNWSSKKVPAKYNYLQKQIDKIWNFIEGLPAPSLDLAAFPPPERDLVETLYGCALLAAREREEENKELGYSNSVISINDKLIDIFALEYLSMDELNKARQLINKAPSTLNKKNDRFWYRDPKPNLFLFLEKQQNLNQFLPKGRINFNNLTWTGWEELLILAEKHGYIRFSDDTINMIQTKDWQPDQQRKLIHLFLEAINDKKITEIFNTPEINKRGNYTIRKRFYYFTRQRST